MSAQKSPASFAYRNKKNETPFETFLRYTDQKERSAVELAEVLTTKLSKGSKLLDIGTGNGEYLHLALSKLKDVRNVELTMVEPSDDLVKQLETRFEELVSTSNLKIIQSSLEDLVGDDLFDVILMSHLFYHVPRLLWPEQLAKALSLLKPDGVVLIVLREKDDAYNFNMTFKPLLLDKSFTAYTIDDVLDALPTTEALKITKHSVAAELKIPFEQNMDDTIAIIEFYLNKQWQDIPTAMQQDALKFIEAKSGIFKQLDCIAIIRRS